MAKPIVFFDIAGPEESGLKEFYATAFDWDIAADGQFEVSAATPISATIRNDSAEKRIYVGVPDVTASLTQIEAAGGSVDVARFEVPGVVVLGLFRDPAGNPMGLVEMDGDTHKVP